LVVNTVELLRRPGSRRAVAVDEDVSELATSGATASRLVGTLELESMNDSLVASGHLDLHWRGECRRCLAPTSGVSPIELREIFERRPTEGETYLLDDDHVDLAPVLADAVMLELPLAPLCGGDCRGPAPERYATGPAPDDEAPVDPRWAALDVLKGGAGEGQGAAGDAPR
jgi:uncharacterized protein